MWAVVDPDSPGRFKHVWSSESIARTMGEVVPLCRHPAAPERGEVDREGLAALQDWCAQHGAALKPHGADTYGEGMRDAKQQVATILARLTRDTAHAEGGRVALDGLRAGVAAVDAPTWSDFDEDGWQWATMGKLRLGVQRRIPTPEGRPMDGQMPRGCVRLAPTGGSLAEFFRAHDIAESFRNTEAECRAYAEEKAASINGARLTGERAAKEHEIQPIWMTGGVDLAAGFRLVKLPDDRGYSLAWNEDEGIYIGEGADVDALGKALRGACFPVDDAPPATAPVPVERPTVEPASGPRFVAVRGETPPAGKFAPFEKGDPCVELAVEKLNDGRAKDRHFAWSADPADWTGTGIIDTAPQPDGGAK
jgi:hypothetical protein